MKRTLLNIMLFLGVLLLSNNAQGQITLWVGESYQWDVAGSMMGSVTDVNWSTSGGYISLSGSGYYRNITVTQYFSGEATAEATQGLNS